MLVCSNEVLTAVYVRVFLCGDIASTNNNNPPPPSGNRNHRSMQAAAQQRPGQVRRQRLHRV
jgi:hypothetical protein